MNAIRFVSMPTEAADRFRAGAPDANGQAPERHVSDGEGVPCRHCLDDVARGAPYLILAYRPFPTLQPYAEVGPIFLHADGCPRHAGSGDLPEPLLRTDQFLLKGYNAEDRIIYGTGQIARTDTIPDIARTLFERPEIAYLHLRSAKNNCFRCRIERG